MKYPPVNSDDVDTSRWFDDEVQVHAVALRAWLRAKYPALVDPDNLVQESLARVWRAAQRARVNSPKAFLFTTASHLALNELRRRPTVGIEAVDDDHIALASVEAVSTPDMVAHREELTLLAQAVQTLPPRCRQALTLRLYGLAQKEIAAELGISERAVEAHLTNGLRGCTKFLAKWGVP